MLSASPETDPLIGVDPNDTSEAKFGGASFTIGVIPAGEWEVLEARHSLARQRATRRVIKRLADEGIDAEKVLHTTKDGLTVTEADMAVMTDPEFVHESVGIYADAAKLAVRNHSGFVNRNGEPFPFQLENGVVAPAVMDVYRRNGKLLKALWVHIRALNDMGVLAKKA